MVNLLRGRALCLVSVSSLAGLICAVVATCAAQTPIQCGEIADRFELCIKEANVSADRVDRVIIKYFLRNKRAEAISLQGRGNLDPFLVMTVLNSAGDRVLTCDEFVAQGLESGEVKQSEAVSRLPIYSGPPSTEIESGQVIQTEHEIDLRFAFVDVGKYKVQFARKPTTSYEKLPKPFGSIDIEVKTALPAYARYAPCLQRVRPVKF